MRPVIIGLLGKAGSGKTSVANYLEKKYDVKRVAFAAPLKRMAKDIWEFSDDQVYGEADVKEAVDLRWGVSPRVCMQRLGQAARDHLGDDCWILAALNSVDGPGVWVIEDVRYQNEVDTVAKLGFVWRLHCEDSISHDQGTHLSESQVDTVPTTQIFRELRSSRQQGLPHLFGLVDQAWDETRRAAWP